jgi:hypothetical protein
MVWRLPPRPPGGFLAVGTCQEDDVPRMMGEFAAPWFLGGENPGFLQISPKKTIHQYSKNFEDVSIKSVTKKHRIL